MNVCIKYTEVDLVIWVEQVKELGAVVENCSCVTADVAKIFSVYWYLGVPHTPIPPDWPVEYKTSFNKETPMKVLLNATESLLYLSVSRFLYTVAQKTKPSLVSQQIILM